MIRQLLKAYLHDPNRDIPLKYLRYKYNHFERGKIAKLTHIHYPKIFYVVWQLLKAYFHDPNRDIPLKYH